MSSREDTAGDTDRAGDLVDVWRLLGLPGALVVANYLTRGHATQYRLIVDVLLDEQQHNLTGVAHADLDRLVRQRLRDQLGSRVSGPGAVGAADRALADDVFNLEQRMRTLAGWGVVDAWEDRVRADEDFHRHLARYQLTELAAKLHRAVRALDAPTVTAVAATLAPAILARELTRAREQMDVDPTEVAQALAVVQSTIEAMAAAAAGWQAKLAGALAGTPDQTKLDTVRDTLTRYLDMWGAGVDTHSATIAAQTRHLAIPTISWRLAALTALGADVEEDRVAELVTSWTDTLAVVGSWFGGPGSQARVLRRQMRDTIAPMIRGQRTLAAVGGHVSRRADLIRLAGALESSPTDEAAWDLWCEATGLFSARHLAGHAPLPAGQPGATSWWDSDPVPVEARLRRQGPRAATGRPAQLADRSVGRAAARAAAATERARRAADRQALLARSGQRLSDWSDASEFEVTSLLEFLAALDRAPVGPDGTRVTLTADGLTELRAVPARAGAAAAVVHARTGRLVVDDVELHLRAVSTS